jgi:hypothetical protein
MTNCLVLARHDRAVPQPRPATARRRAAPQPATTAPCLGAALLLASGCWIVIGSTLLLLV